MIYNIDVIEEGPWGPLPGRGGPGNGGKNTMMTKDDERKALAAIEAILNKCDPDGYVAAAFSGCVADARENIENDFMCSYRERYERAEDDRAEAARKLVKVRAELASMTDRLELADAAFKDSTQALSKARAELEEEKAARAAAEAANMHLNDEVIRLKARLFDMMEALDR